MIIIIIIKCLGLCTAKSELVNRSWLVNFGTRNISRIPEGQILDPNERILWSLSTFHSTNLAQIIDKTLKMGILQKYDILLSRTGSILMNSEFNKTDNLSDNRTIGYNI